MEVLEQQENRKRRKEPYREIYEIVNDILRFVASKYNCSAVEITYGASLTFSQQKCYLNHLTTSGLILISLASGYCVGYSITDFGRRYLDIRGNRGLSKSCQYDIGANYRLSRSNSK